MGVLRHPGFLLLFLARTVSLLGSAAAPIALAFSVLDLPGAGATTLGLTLAGRSVAQLVLLMAGGVLADRASRFRIMVVSDLIAFAGQAALAVLIFSATTSTVALVLFNTIAGAAGALFLPASRGAVVQVVPAEELQAANALLRLSRNATAIGGVALGGLLVATVGGAWALTADAATFLVSALLLAGVRAAPAVRAVRTSVLVDLRTGWHEFVSRAWIWRIVLQFAVVNLCFGGLQVLGPVTAERSLGGPAAWALISGGMAVGLVAGSLIAMRLHPSRPMRVAVLATFGFVPPLLLIGLGAPVWLSALSMLVNGVCVDIFEVLWETTLQRHVPAEALGRIGSYDMVASFVLGPVALVAVGPIAQAYGVGRTLVTSGLLLAAACVATFASRAVRSCPAAPVPVDHHNE